MNNITFPKKIKLKKRVLSKLSTPEKIDCLKRLHFEQPITNKMSEHQQQEFNQEDINDAKDLQSLIEYMSTMLMQMEKDLEITESELEMLRRENDCLIPKVRESLQTTILQNAQLDQDLKKFLSPVISAINRQDPDFAQETEYETETETRTEVADLGGQINQLQLKTFSACTSGLNPNVPIPKKSELMICLEKLIQTDEEMLVEFQQLKTQCKSDHRKCNEVKKVWTPFAAAGTLATLAGLATAIPTGGATLFLTWGGICTTLLGASTNALADMIKNERLNAVKKKLENHCVSREKIQMEYQENVVVFKKLVEDILLGYGSVVNEHDVQRIVYVLTEAGGISLISVGKHVSKMRLVMEDTKIRRHKAANGKTPGHKDAFTTRNVPWKVGNGFMAVAGLKAAGAGGGAKLGSGMLKTILPRASVVLGVLFIAVDVGFLVKDLVSQAELVQPIANEMEKIQEELKILREEKKKLLNLSSLNE